MERKIGSLYVKKGIDLDTLTKYGFTKAGDAYYGSGCGVEIEDGHLFGYMTKQCMLLMDDGILEQWDGGEISKEFLAELHRFFDKKKEGTK